jgi:hypothetical protein
VNAPAPETTALTVELPVTASRVPVIPLLIAIGRSKPAIAALKTRVLFAEKVTPLVF